MWRAAEEDKQTNKGVEASDQMRMTFSKGSAPNSLKVIETVREMIAMCSQVLTNLSVEAERPPDRRRYTYDTSPR